MGVASLVPAVAAAAVVAVGSAEEAPRIPHFDGPFAGRGRTASRVSAPVVNVESALQCGALCRDTAASPSGPQCVAFSYRAANNVCWLLESGEMAEKAGPTGNANFVEWQHYTAHQAPGPPGALAQPEEEEDVAFPCTTGRLGSECQNGGVPNGLIFTDFPEATQTIGCYCDCSSTDGYKGEYCELEGSIDVGDTCSGPETIFSGKSECKSNWVSFS